MHVLICGASGALGSACAQVFEAAGDSVKTWGRQPGSLTPGDAFDAVVWAQGANLTADLQHTSDTDWDRLWQANVTYIVETLRTLLDQGALRSGARLVALSSVWQHVARPDKVAYVTTKAAVGGLVRALCADLGPRGIAMNAVLPGVIDTQMTRSNLSPEQVRAIERETPSGRLATPLDVARTVRFLAGPESAGISGQSIVVDHGWSVTRHV